MGKKARSLNLSRRARERTALWAMMRPRSPGPTPLVASRSRLLTSERRVFSSLGRSTMETSYSTSPSGGRKSLRGEEALLLQEGVEAEEVLHLADERNSLPPFGCSTRTTPKPSRSS